MKTQLILGLAASMAAVAGCTKYYQVTDPASGRSYYAERVEGRTGGAVSLKDARTGDMVTLQNSEVREITETEYKRAKMGQPVLERVPATPASSTLPPVPDVHDSFRDDAD